jgi:hypothetical protein
MFVSFRVRKAEDTGLRIAKRSHETGACRKWNGEEERQRRGKQFPQPALAPKGGYCTSRHCQVKRRREVEVFDELNEHFHGDRGTKWTCREPGCQTVYTVEDIAQASTAFPLHVVSNMPCLESRQTSAGSAPGMSTEASSSERTKDGLGRRKT